MFKSRAFWWILLVTWMTGATYWHVCKIKQLCGVTPYYNSTTVDVSSLNITDGNKLNLESSGNINFARSKAIANYDAAKSELDSMVRYLKANPTKYVTIKGAYLPDETNYTTFSNLGLARASNIKKYMIIQGLPDSIFVISSQVRLNNGNIKDSVIGGIEFQFSDRRLPSLVQ
jgi:OOP family OmpA-OmpF porin